MGHIRPVPHLNIYVDEKAGRFITQAAKRERVSLSRWAREKLLAATGSHDWPAGYRELIGSVEDDDFVAPPEGRPELDQPASWE